MLLITAMVDHAVRPPVCMSVPFFDKELDEGTSTVRNILKDNFAYVVFLAKLCEVVSQEIACCKGVSLRLSL